MPMIYTIIPKIITFYGNSAMYIAILLPIDSTCSMYPLHSGVICIYNGILF